MPILPTAQKVIEQAKQLADATEALYLELAPLEQRAGNLDSTIKQLDAVSKDVVAAQKRLDALNAEKADIEKFIADARKKFLG
jgi:cell division protein FtsB